MDINIMMHSMSGGPSGKTHSNSFKSAHYLSQAAAAKGFTTMNVETSVTLNMDVNPPLLITPQGGSEIKQVGHKRNLWNSLRNMFSVSTGTTWINPQYIQQMPGPGPPPPPLRGVIPEYQDPCYLNQQLLADCPYSNPQMDGLWYPARPGGNQWELLDPLMSPWLTGNQHLDSYKSVTGDHQPKNVISDIMSKKVSPPLKCQKPLNPEAKEWIPQEMRDIKECISSFSTLIENEPLREKSSLNEIVENKIFPVNTTSRENVGSISLSQPLSSKENNEFCEISDLEIKAVRDEKSGKKTTENKKNMELAANQFDIKNKKQNISQGRMSKCKMKSIFDYKGLTTTSDQIVTGCDNKVNIGKTVCDNKISKSPTTSYANVAGKMPEPVCLQEQPCGKDIVLTSNEQQLAKILTKDKKYPKEKAALSVENTRKPFTPYKTCSKSQKKVRKKFLDELKTSNTDFQTNEYSCSPLSSSLPSTVGSPCRIPSVCETIPGLALSSSVKSHERSTSESSSGSRNIADRNRSISDSSSAFSLDIEFEDIKDEQKNVESSSNRQCNNDILAHILGLQDDSDSEDNDSEDDDSDWDEVDAEDIANTWEFTPSFMALQGLCKIQEGLCKGITSEKCNDTSTFAIIELDEEDPIAEQLKEVNKKWNNTYTEIISLKDCKVTFGEVELIVPELTWSDEDLTNSRRGPWEQYARDRLRFKSRIEAVESNLSSIFDIEHRQTVFNQRFMGHDS
ncbi:unnamed protein product [Meganyctiphanes norvegica]|uniref:Protein DP71L n=1 Tax=Meganyctiphanes norvegica TaxID=48144 RepID=A0AAV2QQM9_MEGNR